ncbi:DNA translocase FtsK 4TM domain-containing protein [Sinirhodobacter sp. WL0062]|uniref:DNA translocase FtsK n=1 Tax=Rhodobacter flavimaris TaxID=2907145 RepID=A0ABS8YTY1_9RHOB|nr:DNA translocase FtsK [Sinirhodobacter sp. WL0062]MCE5973319.1 DNA translocase FtsK 4TM domain-containing protein [Sinirhodobacter sp. WL0062]
MASYQVRQRDPLLDQNTQAILERRGKELVGAVLIFAGVLVAMLLGSYSPEDPSWMAASEEPVQNWLGRIGAGIASPLVVIVGRGAWLLPLGLWVWGARFVSHRGEERLSQRAVLLPIAVAVASVYAALLVPPADWGQAFGLGGHFGDMIAGSLLGISPVSGTVGLKLLSLVLAVLTIAVSSFVLGFDRAEWGMIARFLMLGTVAAYAGLMTMLGKGASASVRAAQTASERARQRRAAAAERADDYATWSAQQAWAAEPPLAATPERGSLLSRIRRAQDNEPLIDPDDLEPELFERQRDWQGAGAAPSEDRIRARIAEAVKTRAATAAPIPAAPAAPLRAEARIEEAPAAPPAPASVLAAVAARLARGPKPLVAANRPSAHALRAEPPLQAKPRFMPGKVQVPQPHFEQGDSPILTFDTPAAPQFEPFDIDLDMDEAHFSAPEMDAESQDWDDTADYDDGFAEIDDEIPPAPRMELNRQVIPQAPERRVVMPVKKAPAPSKQAMAEAQPTLRFEAPQHPAYEVPPLSLLTNPTTIQRHSLSDEALEENARMLENVLDDYGVKGEIVSVRPGPVVTMYELEPAPGLKASRVIGLADDIARSMSALSARVSTVPGRSVIGIELPNAHREKVVLREILAARDFGDSNLRLPLALGKDIGGEAVVANLAKMPHLLIAGTTGSGKSVAINTMILSLLYKLSPDECRLIMIDPKMLELSVYDGIPHLLSPVVTDPKKAVVALKWVVGEMEERYRKMSKMGVRNIEGYNGRVKEALAKGELFKRTVQTGFDEETGEPIFETDEFQPQPFPYIVVIVDEMADLMMVAGKEIEACIQRLAQMARASGIHLIMATQRPSVDVITGTIKANFPTRISFQVTSKIDSRTILGEQGAEQLLGMGDMLYMGAGSRITRIHGPFVSDEEVEEIVNHLKSFGPPEYMSGVVDGPDDEVASDIDQVLGLGGNTDGEDALYDQAVAIVIKDRKCSTSYIQRKLGIGYNKAARLVEQMEDQGVVSSANHVGKREILVPEQ